jgi:hypothetical protein
MAIIKSGTSSDQLTIDSTSKAARATLYGPDGNQIYPTRPSGAYVVKLDFTTGTIAAAGVCFLMCNPTGSGKTLMLRRARGRLTWAGTAVAAATYGIEFIRFTGNVSPTGGATVARQKKKVGQPNSAIADANIQAVTSAALTTTGATFETHGFNVIKVPVSVTGTVSAFDIDFAQTGIEYEYVEYEATSGLAIRVIGTTHTAGVHVGGSVEWDEK